MASTKKGSNDPKRSLRPENIALLQEQIQVEDGWGVKRNTKLEFPLKDSSANAGDPALGRLSSDFSEWLHFRDNVEGKRINNVAHSLVWNTDFVNRVNRQRFYFDDFKEKEAAKPVKDTRAVRLRNQRAKQMAGRFRIATKRAQEAKDHAVLHTATQRKEAEDARVAAAAPDVKETRQMKGRAAAMRDVPIPEPPVDTTEGGPNGKKGRRRAKPKKVRRPAGM